MKLFTILFVIISLFSISNTIGQLSWEKVNSPTNRDVLAINIGPDNAMYIIAGDQRTRGYGFGEGDSLFLSLDDGISWSFINVLSDAKGALNDIVLSNQGEIFIGAGYWGGGGVEPPGGIFYSSNGQTWEHIYTDEPGCGHIFKVNLNNNGNLFAITDAGDLFQKILGEGNWDGIATCDDFEGGCQSPFNNWSNGFGVNELKIDSLNQYYISTTRGLYKSNNQGATWADLGLPYSVQHTELYDNLDIVAATQKDGIFYYDLENGDWTYIGLKGLEVKKIYTQHNETLIVVAKDGGFYYSPNNGQTWLKSNQSLENTNILSMSISPSGFFFVATEDGIYRSVEYFEDIYQAQYFEDSVLVEDIVLGIHKNEESNKINDLSIQNYPNPFSEKTNITYTIQQSQNIKLSIYNSYGQLIEVLVDEYKPSGSYNVTWNANNNKSGIYYYQIETRNNSAARKLILN